MIVTNIHDTKDTKVEICAYLSCIANVYEDDSI